MPTCDELLYTFCHHRPDRLLHLFGNTSLLCARCSGIYLGYLAAALVFRLAARRDGLGGGKAVFALAAALVAVVPLEVAAEHFALFDPGNLGRYFTGTALGTGLALFLSVLAFDVDGRETRPRRFPPLLPFWTLLALAAGAAAASLLVSRLLFNALVFAGLAGAYLSVNTLVARTVFAVRGLRARLLALLLTAFEWGLLFFVNNRVMH